MKWQDKKRIDINEYEDICELLNSPASDFYAGSFYFINYIDFANKFRSDLLYFIVEFERVIEASFNSSLDLKDVEIDSFKKMYPNFSNNIFSINTKEDIEKVGIMLNLFRRMNAHSIPSLPDISFLRKCCDNVHNLASQKPFNSEIKYLANNGEISLAGLIFIILNLGREQSIESLTKKNQIFGLISCGKKAKDNGCLFVSEVSHVDLTNPIRESECESIAPAIFGNFLGKMAKDKDNNYSYELIINNEVYKYKIFMNITDKNISVEKGCLTSVYYENKYDLIIEDKTHFIELANIFPPLIFVDLLYKLNITVFDDSVYQYIKEEKNWGRLSKLRYPKFYVDKNIDILLADENNSDIRINSNVSNSALLAVLLRLEKSLIKYGKINIGEFKYSIISQLLEKVGAPIELCEKVQSLRNLVSHCAIIGEYCVSINEVYQYTFENIISLFLELLSFFQNSGQNEIYLALKNDVGTIFIGQVVSIRSKLFSAETIKLMKSYPKFDNLDELKVKRKFYDSTSYSIDVFDLINEVTYGKPRLISLSIKEVDFDLILYISDYNMAVFNEFIERNNLTIKKDKTVGLVRYISLK